MMKPLISNTCYKSLLLCFMGAVMLSAIMILPLLYYKQMQMSNADIMLLLAWFYLPLIARPYWKSKIAAVKNKYYYLPTVVLIFAMSLLGVAFMMPTYSWVSGTALFLFIGAVSSALFIDWLESYMLFASWSGHGTQLLRNGFTAYVMGAVLVQGVLTMFAGNWQVIHRNSIIYSWSLVFYGLGGLFLLLWFILGVWASFNKRSFKIASSSMNDAVSHSNNPHILQWKSSAMICSAIFFLFIQIPEGLLRKMSVLYIIDAVHRGGFGLSPQEYGFVQGTIGVLGLFAGCLMAYKTLRNICAKRCFMVLSLVALCRSMVFICLAYTFPTTLSGIGLCLFLEQMLRGIIFVGLLLCIIKISKGRSLSALLTVYGAVMCLSLMVSELLSGQLQMFFGYRQYFILVFLICLLFAFISIVCSLVDMIRVNTKCRKVKR